MATLETPEARERQTSTGAQRLSLERLREWQRLEYGMFIHFGLTTFVDAPKNIGLESCLGIYPSSLYAPERLDVNQWIRVARDAGMRYAVLTAKHHTGHCLWPSEHTDYHVGTSGDTTDVVGEFVRECRDYGITPGLYYASWDEHHRLGSRTIVDVPGGESIAPEIIRRLYTTPEYQRFQLAQIEELLTRYGPIGELWVDWGRSLGPYARTRLYEQAARLAPDTVVLFNASVNDGTKLNLEWAWPTDVHTLETYLPETDWPSWRDQRIHGYNPWRTLELDHDGPNDYYIPGEVCECIGEGYEWFRDPAVRLKSDSELLAIRLLCRARGTNLLLNVPPERSGQLSPEHVDALLRLRENMERLAGIGSRTD